MVDWYRWVGGLEYMGYPLMDLKEYMSKNPTHKCSKVSKFCIGFPKAHCFFCLSLVKIETRNLSWGDCFCGFSSPSILTCPPPGFERERCRKATSGGYQGCRASFLGTAEPQTNSVSLIVNEWLGSLSIFCP